MVSGKDREGFLKRIESITCVEYSPYQREVLLYPKGSVVMAGAGSGKTSVLAAKAAMYFLEFGRVDDLLLATFSKKAAGELNERVTAILSQLGGNTPASTCEAKTLHALFYRVLINLGYVFDIISDLDERDIIRRILKEEHIYVKSEVVGLGERDESLRVLAEAFNYATNKLIDLKEVYDFQELGKYVEFEGFKKLGQQLDHIKLIEHKYTLEDLQRVLARVLLSNKNNERGYINSLYNKFIIDEFQDTSPIQARILKVMAHGKEQNCNFIGDIEQSIYGFRGASPEILANIDQVYNIKRFNLPVNYRSTSAVVEKANLLASFNSYNIDRAPMEVVPGAGEGFVGYQKVAHTEVYTKIYEYIKEKRDKDVSLTVCVETRTNAQNILTHLKLLSKGIKHSYSGEIHLTKTLKSEMNLIALLADRDVYDGGRTLYNILNLTVQKAHIINDVMFENEVGIYGFFDKLYAEPGDAEYEPVLIKKLENKIGNILEVKSRMMPLRQILLIPDEVTRFLKVCELYEVRQEKGVLKTPNLKRLFQEKKNVLSEMLQECGDFEALADKLEAIENKSLPAGESGYNIVVQTIHQSKGLEFDYIVRPFCDILNQPNMARLEKLKAKGFSVGSLRAEVEEERRLEYVALTRAKKECIYFISEVPSEVAPFIYELFGKTDSKYYKDMQQYWTGLNI